MINHLLGRAIKKGKSSDDWYVSLNEKKKKREKIYLLDILKKKVYVNENERNFYEDNTYPFKK